MVCGLFLGAQIPDPGEGSSERLRILLTETQTCDVVPDGRFEPGEWLGAYQQRVSESIEVFLMADSAKLCIGFRFLDEVEAVYVAEVYIAINDREFLNLHSSGALGEGVNRFSEDLERAAFSVGNSTGWESNVTASGARAQGKEFKINRQRLPGSTFKLTSGLIVANREVREATRFPDRFDFAGETEWVEVVLLPYQHGSPSQLPAEGWRDGFLRRPPGMGR